MGYDTGKYGNLMASVHSIIGRLEKRGEIRSSGTIGGKPAHVWVPKTLIEQFGQGVAEGMAGAAGESPYGALAASPSKCPISTKNRHPWPLPLRRGRKRRSLEIQAIPSM